MRNFEKVNISPFALRNLTPGYVSRRKEASSIPIAVIEDFMRVPRFQVIR